jgi:hypothetical protein
MSAAGTRNRLRWQADVARGRPKEGKVCRHVTGSPAEVSDRPGIEGTRLA